MRLSSAPWQLLATAALGLLVLGSTKGSPSKGLGTLTSEEIAARLELSTAGSDLLGKLKKLKLDAVSKGKSKAPGAKEAMSQASKVLPPVLEALSVANGLFDVLSAVLVPRAGSAILYKFNRLHRRVQDWGQLLDKIIATEESSLDFPSWFPDYTGYKSKIKNGEKKLDQLMTKLRRAKALNQKVKLAREYMAYYKSQGIEEATNSLIRLTASGGTATKPNLFQIHNKKHDCDLERLSGIMISVTALAYAGLRQIHAHSFLARNNPSQKRARKVDLHNQLNGIKIQYDKMVSSCYDSGVTRAKKKIKEILTSNPQMKGSQLTAKIHSEISGLVSWYRWSVVQADKVGQLKFPSHKHTQCVAKSVKKRGHQLFSILNNKRNILVMWEEVGAKSQGCGDITYAKDFVPFQLCRGCNSDVLRTHSSTLSGQKCPQHLKTEVSSAVKLCGYRNLPSSMRTALDSKQYSFVAGNFITKQKPCRRESCRGHGHCRQIRDTTQHQCLCHKYYYGESCEIRFDPTELSHASEIMASLRKNFGQLIGKTGVMDVYLQIVDFPKQMRKMQRNVKVVQKFNNKLTPYVEGIVKAEFIANKYNQLLSGRINDETFSKDMAKLGNSFTLIFHNLKKIVLVKEGLVMSLMKAQRGFVCAAGYSSKISSFMKYILTLDETLTEAQIRHLYWKLRNEGSSTKQRLAAIRNEAVSRQKIYTQHWKSNSCPPLSAENLVESHCGNSLSYEGLTVKLHCRKGMKPSVPTVKCQRKNGKLFWSAKPVCQYQTGAWSSWTRCSKTCGGGTRQRTRMKTGKKEIGTEKCETQDCCQKRYSKFKCDNGKCISSSLVCNGIDECGDWSDEGEERKCSYLRSGDKVALRNGCGGFMHEGKEVTTSDCPGTQMNDEDWANCKKATFRLRLAHDRKGRKAIRSGDEITIDYKDDLCMNCHLTKKKVWFIPYPSESCYMSRVCTSKTKIFARNRQGNCKGDVHKKCHGEPIQPSDWVYLWHMGKWISGGGLGKGLYRSKCLGEKITPTSNLCKCERFLVFKQ